MKLLCIPIGLIVIFLVFGVYLFVSGGDSEPTSSVGEVVEKITDKPLNKYSIENLSKRTFFGSDIILEERLETNTDDAYTVEKFYFISDGKKVTGLAHIPISKNKSPVIVQLRGYVEQSIYQPGIGTKRSAEVYAKNGFISLAPDHLGYGGSDNPSEDVFEERFQTYTTILNLLASIKSLPMADSGRVGIWGHSNGGQQALTVLEITNDEYPTVLWAPVAKVFPYSILYFTDEAEDKGKALRKKLADFENNYDVDKYTLVNYLDRINAPILIHQGALDDAVPVKWSNEFVESLLEKNKDIVYYVYPGADHNLSGAWNTVVERDVNFFLEKMNSVSD